MHARHQKVAYYHSKNVSFPQAVANPEASVAKKIKRNVAKKESRKRKFEAKKTSRRIKKTKANDRWHFKTLRIEVSSLTTGFYTN